MGCYIANRSSFLQKEVVVRSWMCTTDNMFVFFPCSYDSVYYNCFIEALLIVYVLKQPFKASLKGTMKIEIKLKKLVFSFFLSNRIENTNIVNNFVSYEVVFFYITSNTNSENMNKYAGPYFFLCSRSKIIRRKDQSEACKIC